MKQNRWMTSVIAAAAEAATSPMPALPWTRMARAARSDHPDRTDRQMLGATRSQPGRRAAIRSA